MPIPTPQQLNDPAFAAALRAMIDSTLMWSYPQFTLLRKRTKFRKTREVHAARARKLRRRGEYVHFLRWDHGHCIYGWSGPAPQTFTLNRMPRKKADTAFEQMKITTSTIVYGVDWGYCMTSAEPT